MKKILKFGSIIILILLSNDFIYELKIYDFLVEDVKIIGCVV